MTISDWFALSVDGNLCTSGGSPRLALFCTDYENAQCLISSYISHALPSHKDSTYCFPCHSLGLIPILTLLSESSTFGLLHRYNICLVKFQDRRAIVVTFDALAYHPQACY